jgi:hypothetical protein
MKLTYREMSSDPPSYRVSVDGVEIGSIALAQITLPVRSIGIGALT